jgi:hypothetical protein
MALVFDAYGAYGHRVRRSFDSSGAADIGPGAEFRWRLALRPLHLAISIGLRTLIRLQIRPLKLVNANDPLREISGVHPRLSETRAVTRPTNIAHALPAKRGAHFGRASERLSKRDFQKETF